MNHQKSRDSYSVVLIYDSVTTYLGGLNLNTTSGQVLNKIPAYVRVGGPRIRKLGSKISSASRLISACSGTPDRERRVAPRTPRIFIHPQFSQTLGVIGVEMSEKHFADPKAAHLRETVGHSMAAVKQEDLRTCNYE